MNLNGFFNAMAYGLSDSMQSDLKGLCCPDPDDVDDDDEDEDEDDDEEVALHACLPPLSCCHTLCVVIYPCYCMTERHQGLALTPWQSLQSRVARVSGKVLVSVGKQSRVAYIFALSSASDAMNEGESSADCSRYLVCSFLVQVGPALGMGAPPGSEHDAGASAVSGRITV